MNSNQPSMLSPALIGGAVLGITSALPVVEFLNCACCGLIVGGGLLSSYLYLRQYPSQLPPVTYGEGALLGLSTGAVGTAIYAIVRIPLQFVQIQLGIQTQEIARLEEALSNPQIPEALRNALRELFEGGTLSIGVLVLEVVAFLAVALVFATLGGILGIALFQKRTQPEIPFQAPPTGPPGAPDPPGSQ